MSSLTFHKDLRFEVADFVYNYLARGVVFANGLTSTAPIAGTVTTRAAFRAGFGGANPIWYGRTVADHFNNAPSGLQVNALTSITSPFLIIFFRPETVDLSGGGTNARNPGLLFHEALHGYGGAYEQGATHYGDQELRDIFGIGPNGNISEYISKHCF